MTKTEITLFGFTRLAHASHTGNVGIKTGATSRPAGKTHLFNPATERTACGRQRREMFVTLIPANVTEQTWPVRVALCSQCRKAAGVPAPLTEVLR